MHTANHRDGHDGEVDRALEAIARLTRDGLVREALAASERLLRHDPCNGRVWRVRAHLLARHCAWSHAIDSLARAAAPCATPTIDLLSGGRWRLEAGDLIGAIADFSALLARRLQPEARPWLGLARFLRAIAQYDAGLYANTLRDCTRLPDTVCGRARGRYWQVRAMRRDAEAALRIVPQFPYAS